MGDESGTGPLSGVRVVAFESRRAAEIELLLARHGATVFSAPALREVPIAENAAALELVARLESGTIDVLVLLTGVGTRALVDAVRERCPTERLVELLRRVRVVARGPKPVAALRALGLVATVRVPEPNTWRDLLEALDRELPVRGLQVAVQEYGKANPSLLDGLAARGARDVLRVPVYRWALPHDLVPLEQAIARIAARAADVAVFTTAVQLDHLCQLAASTIGVDALVTALRDDLVVAAIGPTAAEALTEAGIPPDLQPEHPKLGYLVNAIAERAPRLLAAKRARPGAAR